MWKSFALATFHHRAGTVSSRVFVRAPAVVKSSTSTTARFVTAYACDRPDGDHDLQDVEESSDWAKRTIDIASVVENADKITATHEAVFGETLFAVDAPDGEHDMELQEEHLTGVNNIIDQASVLESPDEVRYEQQRREELHKESYNPDAEFYNQKY